MPSSREASRKWRAANPEKAKESQRKYRAANPEKAKESQRKWRAANPEKAKESQRKYRAANPEKNKEASRKWRAKDPEKARKYNTQKNRIWRAKDPEKPREALRRFHENHPEYQRKWNAVNPEYKRKWNAANPERVKKSRRKWKKYKRATDPNWKLTENMRSGMHSALAGRSKSAPTMKIIGCTAEALFKHLLSCASREPWMTRENYGKGGWDVDHIIAVQKWDYNCPLQFVLCWDKSNLQPMEHIANCRKGAK